MVSTNPSKAQDVSSSASESLQYAVRRGDGSTGGGGLPMPRSKPQIEDEDESGSSDLVRPKVCSCFLRTVAKRQMRLGRVFVLFYSAC